MKRLRLTCRCCNGAMRVRYRLGERAEAEQTLRICKRCRVGMLKSLADFCRACGATLQPWQLRILEAALKAKAEGRSLSIFYPRWHGRRTISAWARRLYA